MWILFILPCSIIYQLFKLFQYQITQYHRSPKPYTRMELITVYHSYRTSVLKMQLTLFEVLYLPDESKLQKGCEYNLRPPPLVLAIYRFTIQ